MVINLNMPIQVLEVHQEDSYPTYTHYVLAPAEQTFTPGDIVIYAFLRREIREKVYAKDINIAVNKSLPKIQTGIFHKVCEIDPSLPIGGYYLASNQTELLLTEISIAKEIYSVQKQLKAKRDALTENQIMSMLAQSDNTVAQLYNAIDTFNNPNIITNNTTTSITKAKTTKTKTTKSASTKSTNTKSKKESEVNKDV